MLIDTFILILRCVDFFVILNVIKMSFIVEQIYF